jgi:hypothetical protein
VAAAAGSGCAVATRKGVELTRLAMCTSSYTANGILPITIVCLQTCMHFRPDRLTFLFSTSPLDGLLQLLWGHMPDRGYSLIFLQPVSILS